MGGAEICGRSGTGLRTAAALRQAGRCRSPHPGRASRHDNGLWAGPYQPSARVRVTAPMVREILLAAGLTEHQPGTAGFLITDQPDGRIRVEPASAAGQSAPQRDAEHFRLERLRSLHREAVDRSCVIKEVDGLAYLLAPESLPQADPA